MMHHDFEYLLAHTLKMYPNTIHVFQKMENATF
jgi:hypothetical protein